MVNQEVLRYIIGIVLIILWTRQFDSFVKYVNSMVFLPGSSC